MTESEFAGWFQGEPAEKGRYLIIDTAFWHDKCAVWVPGDRGRPGRWYPDGGTPLGAEDVALFRKLPKIPLRPQPVINRMTGETA